MSFTDTPLHDEIAAAVEWVADRALGALSGAGGTDALAGEPPTGTDPRTVLAAVRVLGPDVFAPSLLTGAPCGAATVQLVEDACRLFPAADLAATAASVASPDPDPATSTRPGPVGPALPPGALVVGWRDWATAELLARVGRSVPVPRPAVVPELAEPSDWARWSLQLARLAGLALPTLESPVHELARREPLALARGATRSILRRDHRTAVRLARWLAWLAADGTPLPLDLPPLLRHLRWVGDVGPRSVLDLEIADLLLGGRPRPLGGTAR
ncbi:hypothetical protein [Kitasatospora sp. NBC_01266]|uniref:hypothetical protein n=1 Tax=Kitasatospora sp. NBC_01266 TaxID=2903572 RepID=UPI002E32FEE3|nr:hypothetical protein [Kitasatospora sp. NBC_01266]